MGDAGQGRPIRLLTISSLFPNPAQPSHGVFVENRLRHLLAGGGATARVIAPVPWFPSANPRFGDWAKYAAVPAAETRHGIAIAHPRYVTIPRVGMELAPYLYYRALLPAVRQALREAPADLIDAHYFYPDGVAAVWVGAAVGLPVVVTSRGTDVNLIPRYPVPRRLLRAAVARADALVGVSAALVTVLTRDLGADPSRARVLRNGVDTAVFHPVERETARAALGLTRPTLISVGHLIERKGHHRIIEAMRLLPGCELLIVGEGPERAALEAQIAQGDMARRVRLMGACPHESLPMLYSAADVLVLASTREGWANVLLEAMACGTPVVASNAWGNPEVVRAPEAGIIIEENTPEGIAQGVRTLLATLPDRDATRAYAEGFSWDATTAGQLALFREVLARRGAAGATGR